MFQRIGGLGMHGVGGISLINLGGKGQDADAAIELVASADTWIDNSSPLTNFSTETYIRQRYHAGSYSRTGLLQFDLSSLAGQTITAATMRLVTTTDVEDGTPVTVTAHRILDANDVVISQATWNICKTGTNWIGSAGCSTSGTDYDVTPVATGVTVALGGGVTVDIVFDANGVIDLQGMIDGTNRGFRLLSGGLANANRSFASMNHATVGIRPRLLVTL